MAGSFDNVLETIGDRDWIRVTLTAGQSVLITLSAGGADPITDPYLRLYGTSGALISENDDYSGYNSGLIYTATTSGSFYIAAGAYGDGETGTYHIEVAAVATPTVLDSIDWGTKLPDNNVTVYFATSGQTFDGMTSEGFNAYEREQFLEAFGVIASYTNLTFTTVTSAAAADFVLVLDLNEFGASGDLAYFNPPGTTNAGVGVFNGAAWDRSVGGGLERGGYDFVTIVHELGHGLGMAHPHDTGGTSTIMDGVTNAFDSFGTHELNQGVYTIMSYNSGFHVGSVGTAGDSGNQWGYEGGPMALDIAVLQEKYGADASTGAGNTTYVLPGSNVDGTFWQAIWDVSGTDEIVFAGALAVTIDLREATLTEAFGGGGYISAAVGIAGGYTVTANTDIENASGGSGNDTLRGNALANTLLGNSGNDTLTGDAGRDRLDGGSGNDTMNGGTGDDIYVVGATGDVLTGEIGYSSGGGIDTVESWVSFTLASNYEILRLQGTAAINGTGNGAPESIVGNSGINVLTGGGGNDTLNGKGSGDRLVGGGGVDTLVGDTGSDTFAFTAATDSGTGAARDFINGFVHGQDRIDLSAIDARTGGGANDAFTFITTAFTGAQGQLRAFTFGGGNFCVVEADRDGNGAADMQIFVNLTTFMQAGDFIL